MKKIRTLSIGTDHSEAERREHSVSVDPETPLLFVLNDDLGLQGPRFGCGMARGGACTVICVGQTVLMRDGRDEITPLEGLGTMSKPHPIQQAFIDEGAAQCGFCLSGVIPNVRGCFGCQSTSHESGDS